MSDHCPVLCMWLTRRPRRAPKGHSEHLNGLTKMHLKNKNKFISDLSCALFNAAYHLNDPDVALSVWYVIMPATDNHAPLREKKKKKKKREKRRRKKLPWQLEIALRKETNLKITNNRGIE